MLGARILLILSLFFASFDSRAYFELPSEQDSGIREMNGIKFDDYAGFAEKWRLVTVRYRQDTKEMRFVYANDLAFKAMKALNPKYPDGAIFAKLGIETEDDPAFTSSKVPSGAKRSQFMVKDSKKYAATNGWGYALFDAQGNIYQDEPPAKKTIACAACHRIVPERDYIFSRQILLDSPRDTNLAHLDFERKNTKQSPPAFASFLHGYDVYFSLMGELQKSAFSGTLDEIIPSLIEKSRKSATPVALLVDEKNFSLALPGRKSKKACAGSPYKSAYRVIVVYNSKRVRDAEVCQ